MKKIFLNAVVFIVLCSSIVSAETVSLSGQIITLEQSNVLTVEQSQSLIDLPDEVETKPNLFCVLTYDI